MNRKLVSTLLIPLFGLTSLALVMPKEKTVEVSADSEAATLMFARGTAGVDKFYNYCPSIMEESDGTRHIYYCTNKVAGNVTDYIGYRKATLNNGTYTYSSESIVLSPTSDTWDSRHTCDPSVIKGVFTYNNHSYSYLMAYLGCVTSDNSNNEIGLAVSDTPIGPWTKVDSLNPFKHFTPSSDQNDWEWGYGQPSMVSIDKAGQVLFTYTSGDVTGTYIYAEKWNFSNLNNPVQTADKRKLYTNGLRKYDGTVDSVLNNADFAYDEASGRIYAIRDNHPNAEINPTVSKEAQVIYMEPHSSDRSVGGNLFKYGTWKILKDISINESGLERNHNCGLVRDEYGHLNNPTELEVVITDGKENSNFWAALSTYRLYSYNVTVNSTINDYMLDVGANITYNYTKELDIPAFRMMPQNQDFSSGNAISIRIRNNTGIDTPLRISFNCTSDYRYRAFSNKDESKKYYLLSTDGTISEYSYRTWDGDVWLKPNFDGYLVMKKDDQVADTSYPNQGTFTWSSIFAVYFALETHFDYYANYDIGDIYTCSINQNTVNFVKPLLQYGLVTNENTSASLALDYLGEGRINIHRKNISFITAVELVDLVANINSCNVSSSDRTTITNKKSIIDRNGVLLNYFNSVYIYDYSNGDTSHSGELTNRLLASQKYNYILNGQLTNQLFSNPTKDTNNILIVVLISFTTILTVSSALFLKSKKHKNN